MSIKKLGYLKKHVGMVHCAASLSTIQRKIANVLLYNAKTSDVVDNCFSINIGILSDLINYNSNDYRTLKLSLIKLIQTTIEWNVISNSSNEEWVISSLLASARAKKNGILEYSYSKHLLDFINNPSQYASINMDDFVKLKSQYALSLYEQCSRYIRLGQTCWIKLGLFRKIMGVSDDHYKLFKDFRKRVINQAINEINTKTDLRIYIETKREGKNIAYVKFRISSINKSISKSSDIDLNSDLEHRLKKEFFFKESEIDGLLDSYKKEFIKEKIQYIQRKSTYKEGAIKNLKGYLIKALKDDYTNESQKDFSNYDYSKLEEKYTAYKQSFIREWIDSMGESTWNILREEFLSYVRNRDTNDIYYNYLKDQLKKNDIKSNSHFSREITEEIAGFIQRVSIKKINVPCFLSWANFLENAKNNVGMNEKVSSKC